MNKSQKQWIKVVGAREHNLKNISVDIPKDALTVITGPSGSGKSSLALDILYTEGKRRYIESLSSYARQFLGLPKKPDVDRIDGLCPAIAIDQKTVGSNPRSTVGTITEIYDYLRVLFARIGKLACPDCADPITSQAPDVLAQNIIKTFMNQSITIAAPIAHLKKGEFVHELERLFLAGYYRYNIDGQKHVFKKVEDIKALKLKKTERHTIDLLLDACEVTREDAGRIQEAIEKAFELSKGICKIIAGDEEFLYAATRMCLRCNYSFPEVEPRLFSFNSPLGACKKCHGIGMTYALPTYDGPWWSKKAQEDIERDFSAVEQSCIDCEGKRLNKAALAVTVGGKNISQIGDLSIKDANTFFAGLALEDADFEIAERLLQEIVSRLHFLSNVGLDYLSLNRTARTLSGGEGQRIRLATQIGSALSGVLYILDEPSIGLHQRDNDRLIKTLHALRDLGNTVIVVEHDTDTMNSADYLIDMGPAAGIRGGQVVSAGTPEEVRNDPKSLTGAFLSGKREIKVPEHYRIPKQFITLHNARTNNLKNLEVKFPLGVMCGVSGVSGSGKSTLVMEELVPSIQKALQKRSKFTIEGMLDAGEPVKLEGYQAIENMIVIDQSPIGRTSRSTPATYLGIFDDIRALFASLPESNIRGYKAGRFSFNVAEGRCSQCSGEGTVTVAMHFLADVVMTCAMCKGLRFNAQTRQILYKDKDIAQVLDMTVGEATEFFQAHKNLHKRLKLLCDVGLDYIKLGQSSTTLSGGEAQRIKLAAELAKRGVNTLYILDEPTTGLHSGDIEKLLKVLQELVQKGNSLLIIEHNLDVLKTVDYLIDMGPEGGDVGGTVVAQGTPVQVSHTKQSHTGYYLRSVLKN